MRDWKSEVAHRGEASYMASVQDDNTLCNDYKNSTLSTPYRINVCVCVAKQPVYIQVAKADILPAMHVVVRPDGVTTPGDTLRPAEQPRQAPVNTPPQQWRPPPAARQPAPQQPPLTPQPAQSTACHGPGHQVAHQTCVNKVHCSLSIRMQFVQAECMD